MKRSFSCCSPFYSLVAALLCGLWPISAHAVTTTITLNFTDRNGTPAAAPSGSAGQAYCYGGGASSNWISYNDGDTFVAIDIDLASAAQVTCYANTGANFMSDLQQYTVSASPGVAQSISVGLIEKDVSATVSLLDSNGVTFSVPANTSASIQCQTTTTPVRYLSASVPVGQSSVAVPLISGWSYKCKGDLSDYSQSPTIYYSGTFTANFNGSSPPGNLTTTVAPLDAILQLNLLDDNGDPFPTGAGEYLDFNCQATSVGYSSSQFASYIQPNTSSLSIAAPSGVSVTCTAGARSGFPAPAAISLTPTSGQTSAVDFSYLPYPQGVQLNLSDGTSPFTLPTGKTLQLSCSRMSPYHYSSITVPVGASGVRLGLPTGTYNCSLNPSNDLLATPSSKNNVTIATGADHTYNATITELDATIQVVLLDGNGNPFNLPSPGASVSCVRVSGQQYRWIQIPSGNTGSNYVQSGQAYNCTPPNIEGYSVPSAQGVTVATGGGTETLTFVYTPLNQDLTIELKDKNGAPISAPNTANIFCNNTSGSGNYSKQFTVGSSSKTFPIQTGSYTCTLSNVTGYTALASKSVTVVDSVDSTLSFTLFPLDASIEVNLVDSQGNSVSVSGWSSIGCSASGEGYYFYFSKSLSNGNSSGIVDVIGGYSYSCNVQGFDTYSGGNFSVSVQTGQGVVKNFTMLEKNATLRVKLVNSVTGAAVPVPPGTGTVYVGCSNYSGGGSYSSGQLSDGDSQVDLLTVPGAYTCWAQIPGFNVPDSNTTVRTVANSTVDYLIPLEVKDSTITLNFKNNSGASLAVPTDSLWPSASCWSDKGGSYSQLSIGSTSAALQVVGNRRYYCNVSGFKGYNSGGIAVQVGSADSKSVDIILPQLDASITINLETDSNPPQPFTIPDGTTGGADCYQSNFGNYVNLSSGASSGTMNVIGGAVYKCSTWLPNLATAPVAVTVPNNGNATATIKVATPSIPVSVRLVDPDGVVVSNAENMSAGAYSATDEIQHSATATFDNGIAAMNLKATTLYYVNAWTNSSDASLYGLIKAGSDWYLLTGGEQKIQVPASGTATKDLTVKLANATINVSTGGVEGWVHVQPKSDDPSEWLPGVDGEVSSGTLSIPIPPGQYDVNFYPRDSQTLIPKPVQVTLTAGQTKTATFTVISKDLTLNVTGNAGGGSSGYFWCNAFASSGASSFGDGAAFGESAAIGLSTDIPTWTLRCFGYSDETDTIFEGKATYNVPANNPSSDSLQVTLTQKGELLKGESTGSTDSPLSVPVNGDTKLTLDTGTFQSGGTVTVGVNNKGSAPTTSEIEPDAVFDFSASDNTNSPVTADKSVTFQMPLEEDESVYGYTASGGYKPLARSRITESNQSLALFALEEKRARTKSTSLVTVTIPKDVFNSGVVARVKTKSSGGPSPTPTPAVSPTAAPAPDDPAETAPATPNGFKIAKSKKGSKVTWIASWAASAGATGYQITITAGKKTVKKLTVRAGPNPQVTLPKLKKGKYTVTLRATNSAGSSNPVTKKLSV